MPKLSVLVPTFNHGRFIEKMLEGALMQETDFSFDIIVGDDASIDNNFRFCDDSTGEPDKIKRINLQLMCRYGWFRVGVVNFLPTPTEVVWCRLFRILVCMYRGEKLKFQKRHSNLEMRVYDDWLY